MKFFKNKKMKPVDSYKMAEMRELYVYLKNNILSGCNDKYFLKWLETKMKGIELRTRPVMTEVYAQHLYIDGVIAFDVWIDIDYIIRSLEYIPELQIHMMTPSYMSSIGIIDMKDPVVVENRQRVINARKQGYVYEHKNDYIIVAQIPFFSLGGGDGFRIIDGNHRFCEAIDTDSPLKVIIILAPYLLPFFCGDSHELFEVLEECAIKTGHDHLFVDYNLPSR